MGHITRLEEGKRDVEFNSIDKEADRMVAQVTALMSRMVALHEDGDATAEDKADIIARRTQLIDELTAAVQV